MAFRILVLALIVIASPAWADGPTLLGQAMEPVAAPAAPAAPARTAPYQPGFVANGLSSYGGAFLGTLVGLGATALLPVLSGPVTFGIGAALAGAGSALAQYRATGKVDWRSVFFTSLAGGATVLLGGAGAGVKETLAGTAMVVGVGQFFGSVKETTRIRRLWFW